MLVTVGTYRVKRMSVRSASTVCKNLMVRIIGLRCRCFSLASAQMAGPCRSPLPPPPLASPPPAPNKIACSRGVLPRILGMGVPRRFGPYLRTKKGKTDTLFKAQSRKMTPYSRKKQTFGLKRRYVYLPA